MSITDITKQIRAFADELDNAQPPVPVDPYVELKKAHAAGKVIQSFNRERGGIWQDCPYPAFEGGTDYRIKPDAPPFQLPPHPPGHPWHREDGWKPDDLPPGTRPLVLGERFKPRDQVRVYSDDEWGNCEDLFIGEEPYNKCCSATRCSRTTRPLVFTHEGKQWTYHRPGDPMPCGMGAWIVATNSSGATMGPCYARLLDWANSKNIIGWRYAEPVTKEIELGPEDVPPNSVFRGAGEAKKPNNKGWCLITSCSETGIRYWRNSDDMPAELTWKTLHRTGAEINRPRHRDADGNPTLWEKCSKEVPA